MPMKQNSVTIIVPLTCSHRLSGPPVVRALSRPDTLAYIHNSTTINPIAHTFRAAITKFTMRAVRMPRSSSPHISQISTVPNTNVAQPGFSSSGKKAPNESLSIAA